MNVYDLSSKSYNELLGIYLDEYEKCSDVKVKTTDPRYDSINLTLDINDYTEWLKNEVKESVDVPFMPPLEDNKKEVKEVTKIKILTPKKLVVVYYSAT